ncbi:8-amino-7-oxononanoate synthase [uncultured Rikenella sp.]|mgnify:CR=1 FL=1|uniref:aminotransferase class I/II-fold pyridoxal phosphate-dependent enzyme n=1 Tax=uncultured Rikenella sp. TaxID=368003 RepID=UPI0025F1E06A|nr:8-amino-7-oxononanoate synthase [uncultured Rikenella sp.]
MAESRERQILDALAAQGNLRSLCTLRSVGTYIYEGEREYYNLSSNDYLGLAEPALQNRFLLEADVDRFLLGNPASRLMTGNSPAYEALETAVADLLGTERALVLGSGFAVNTGVLPAVTERGDLVLADKLVHASLIDGLRLCGSGVEWRRFRHNDMEQLEAMLEAQRGRGGRIIVVTESLFSMDGDFAPLAELAELQHRYGFRLYLDEAHAFGVYGPEDEDGAGERCGAGLLAAYNAGRPEHLLRADYHVVTFGKALASQGAAVGCSDETKRLLVNRMRPLIFSTALPDISLEWTRFLLGLMPEFAPRRERIRELITLVNKILESAAPYESQIVPIRAGSNERALAMAGALKEEGFWVTAIRHPTVPEGEARLRVSLCAGHTPYKIEQFATLCRQFG